MSGAGRVAVVVVSDRASSGERPDLTGPALAEAVAADGLEVADLRVVPDEPGALADLLARLADGRVVRPAPGLVVTAGGTGLGPRDRTPEATRAAIEREVPGIAEALRFDGRSATPNAVLSRGLAGVRGTTLIVNLPGSPTGATDGWRTLAPVVVHALGQLGGADH